jgi:hypothetical protein
MRTAYMASVSGRTHTIRYAQAGAQLHTVRKAGRGVASMHLFYSFATRSLARQQHPRQISAVKLVPCLEITILPFPLTRLRYHYNEGRGLSLPLVTSCSEKKCRMPRVLSAQSSTHTLLYLLLCCFVRSLLSDIFRQRNITNLQHS